MEITNAIAKVRFNSARPQRVLLTKRPGCACDLLCLEPGQEHTATGACSYYVIAGSGQLRVGRTSKPLAMGHFADCEDGEDHVLRNTSEQRLICLTVSPHQVPG